MSAAEVVERYISARRHGEDGDEYLDPDIVVHEPDSLPYGGDHQGYEGMAELHRIMAETWDLRIGPASDRNVYAVRDRVIIQGHLNATSRASGRDVRVPIMECYRVSAGRIVEIDVYYSDTALMLNAIRAGEA